MQTNVKIQDNFLIVPTAGTRLPLATQSTPCARVTISADENNAGNVSVGGATVVAAVGATRSGCVLQPGGSVAFDIDDLSKVYVDVLNNNDKVLFTWTS
jgi:hypothetical protein